MASLGHALWGWFYDCLGNGNGGYTLGLNAICALGQETATGKEVAA